MSDAGYIDVVLVGGPCDGGTLPVERSELSDTEPGFDFIPEDGSSCPPACSRVLYTAQPSGDPAVWHWRGYVP
jgi:hypothetical protein